MVLMEWLADLYDFYLFLLKSKDPILILFHLTFPQDPHRSIPTDMGRSCSRRSHSPFLDLQDLYLDVHAHKDLVHLFPDLHRTTLCMGPTNCDFITPPPTCDT